MQEETIPQPDNELSGISGGSSDLVTLKNLFQIDPAAPLPEFDSPTAKAYQVSSINDEVVQPLFVLICPGNPMPRTDIMDRLHDLNISGMIRLVEWGPVLWPLSGQMCIAVVYRQPGGVRLSADDESIEDKISEYDLSRKLISPAYGALRDLAEIEVTHRAIRLSNFFYTDADKTTLVLGECVTAPPGFDQPVIFETTDRAMAGPTGRGKGTIYDDLYALGISLVLILLGKNPVAKMSDFEKIFTRAEMGTYASLCGMTRIPISMMEPLRGLLADDELDRWDLGQLEQWLQGRKLTPIQKKSLPRSEHPLLFDGFDHYSTKTLSHAMGANVPGAVELLLTNNLEHWARRDLGNPDLADLIARESYFARDKKSGKKEDVNLSIARLCILLDPAGPIRYKNLSFLMDAFGSMLVSEYLDTGSCKRCAEVLNSKLISIWFAEQEDYSPDLSTLEKQFTQLCGFLQINDYGYGIERCLYELNSHLNCLSPILGGIYITSVNSLILVLDHVAASADQKSKPLDRHIAAFIAARIEHDVSPHLKSVSSPHEDRSLLGMLSLFAFLQWRLKLKPLNDLTKWIGGLMKPVTNMYHSRGTRKELARKIPTLTEKGSLPELFELIGDATLERQDKEGFSKAIIDYKKAETEKIEIQSSEAGETESATRLGQQVSAVTGVVIALISISLTFIMKAW